MKRYNPKDIEPKWQQKWAEAKIYEATEDPAKLKRYVLEYFPYPSGAAMHVGHVRNYTIGDVVARYYRMQGYNVLHPMGWDAFGLPAENYAIKNNISPQQAIAENTAKFKKQLTQMGFSYDWSREINSSDPGYYRWTQWLFKLLFDRGLAYQKESLQWWCEHDKTVLANEQVEAGKCWRCGNAVIKKPLKQWFFKITDYADRLCDDLDKLDWSEAIKSMQRNWIGKSKGAEVDFDIDGQVGVKIKVFTTRPDTLYGATFMALAPEHPLVPGITTPDQKQAIEEYIKQAQAKSDVERQETNREKSGVFTGAYAVNPVNGQKIPVWIADYVLTGYGTGAIMAVPAHDERDHEFARKFNLPIVQVVAPEMGITREDEHYADGGCAIVFDPKRQKYAFGRLENGSIVLFAGGAKDGEKPEQTILRELREESGLHDIAHTEMIGYAYGHYRHSLKNLNRVARAACMLVVLKSDDRKDTQLEAHEKISFEWLDAKEVLDVWQSHPEKDYDHYVFFLKHAVARAIEMGVDTTSDSMVFVADTMSGEGFMVNSGPYDGLESSEAREKIVADLSAGPKPAEYFDERNPIQEGKPVVERIAAQALVQHPTDGTYLLLRLTGWETETYSLPMGGVDGDDDAINGAMRELREETGFVDYEEPRIAAAPYFANFYHEFKKENRRAKIYTVFTRLKSLKQVAVDEKEQALHEPLWVSLDEVKAKVHGEGAAKALQAFAEGCEVVSAPAREVVNYKIRDWLISRQRYWGAPIPIVHCEKDGAVAVPEDQLPVVLPEVKSYQPTGEGTSVLASVHDWVNTTCPTCGGPAKRETDTMDGFACSSWYFLRFADPHNNEIAFDADRVKFWLPVDDYIGGAEHAVMHLLYARMWTKVMFDAGLIEFDEPFTALRNQGMILAPDGRKMSKSWGNVIAPDDIIEQGYGADAIRIMELFIGPWNQAANWSVEGMGGCYRFLQRVWNLTQEYLESPGATDASGEEVCRVTHKTIKKVTEDLGEMGFNTAIASMMDLVNQLLKVKAAQGFGAHEAWQESLSAFAQLLAPFAPHISEELWAQLGNKESVHTSGWPKWDEKYLMSDTTTVAVQVNGKVRAEVTVPTDAVEADVVTAAQAEERVKAHTDGKKVIKTIYVPGKILNLVVK
jgi:leucyl-tRNA synthetase